jgi:5,6-dimethylbenzimidazole synthase
MTAPDFDTAFCDRLHQLFRWRRDVRRFRADAVPPEMLSELFDLATLAPSVGLSQPWRFVMVESETPRAAIRANFAAANQEALASQTPDRAALYARLKLEGLDAAPVQFALFSDSDPAQGHGLGRRTMPQTLAYSSVMALHTLWLAARAVGLGLGWVSILDPAAVRAALDVPEAWEFIGYFCLGWPETVDDVPELEREGWEMRRAARVVVR